jgi:hypothetical protein
MSSSAGSPCGNKSAQLWRGGPANVPCNDLQDTDSTMHRLSRDAVRGQLRSLPALRTMMHAIASTLPL